MRIPVLLCALALAACSGAKDEDAAPADGVFDDLTGTIDRANEVEGKVMEQKDRIDEALRESEGNPDAQDPQG